MKLGRFAFSTMPLPDIDGFSVTVSDKEVLDSGYDIDKMTDARLQHRARQDNCRDRTEEEVRLGTIAEVAGALLLNVKADDVRYRGGDNGTDAIIVLRSGNTRRVDIQATLKPGRHDAIIMADNLERYADLYVVLNRLSTYDGFGCVGWITHRGLAQPENEWFYGVKKYKARARRSIESLWKKMKNPPQWPK